MTKGHDPLEFQPLTYLACPLAVAPFTGEFKWKIDSARVFHPRFPCSLTVPDPPLPGATVAGWWG